MLVSEFSKAEALGELCQRKIIVIKKGKASFHFDFLAKITDEIIRIMYSNVDDEAVLADLRKNKTKLVRLATCNIISRVFGERIDFTVAAESMKILDLMIQEAFPQE